MKSHFAVLVAGVVALAPGGAVHAQQKETSELVLILLSSANCPCNDNKDFAPTIRQIKSELATRAKAKGVTFVSIAVDMNAGAEDGVRYYVDHKTQSGLAIDLGKWDEISVGRRWLNTVAIQRVWQDKEGIASMPQLIVVEQRVSQNSKGFSVLNSTVVKRLSGTSAFMTWLAQGMPDTFKRTNQ